MYWVRKRIRFDSLPTGFDKYDVRVSYVNCLPTTAGNADGDQALNYGRGSTMPEGIWVEKAPTYFDINIAWKGPSPFYQNNTGEIPTQLTFALLPENPLSQNSLWIRSFIVNYSEMLVVDYKSNIVGGGTSVEGQIPDNLTLNVDQIGVCSYPTVQFEIIGYPSTYQGMYNTGLGGDWKGTTSITLF